MGSNSSQNIIDKIIADANGQANDIIEAARLEAEELRKSAEQKAEKEKLILQRTAEEKAVKAKEKEISAAEMQAKKMLLKQKQDCIADIVQEAKERLLSLEGKEYEDMICKMISKAEIGNGCEIILAKKGSDSLKTAVKNLGVPVAEETRDIGYGFIVKNGDIEYNYSFESILAVEKEAIEQAAAEYLFG